MAMVAKGLAKLLEECGEVCAAAGEFLHAVITQSAHEHHGKLRLDLQDELADLWAACSFVAETFELNTVDQGIEANTVSARLLYDTQTLTRLVGATGALAQVAAKKLAYFDTDEHPDGAGSLAARMSQCIEEFLACAGAVSASMLFDLTTMQARKERKLALFRQWHAAGSSLTEESAPGVAPVDPPGPAISYQLRPMSEAPAAPFQGQLLVLDHWTDTEAVFSWRLVHADVGHDKVVRWRGDAECGETLKEPLGWVLATANIWPPNDLSKFPANAQEPLCELLRRYGYAQPHSTPEIVLEHQFSLREKD